MHIKMHIIHTKGILASIPATPSSNTVSNHTELLRVGFPLQALNTSSTVRHKHLAEHRMRTSGNPMRPSRTNKTSTCPRGSSHQPLSCRPVMSSTIPQNHHQDIQDP